MKCLSRRDLFQWPRVWKLNKHLVIYRRWSQPPQFCFPLSVIIAVRLLSNIAILSWLSCSDCVRLDSLSRKVWSNQLLQWHSLLCRMIGLTRRYFIDPNQAFQFLGNLYRHEIHHCLMHLQVRKCPKYCYHNRFLGIARWRDWHNNQSTSIYEYWLIQITMTRVRNRIWRNNIS
jgi:hypothetical protein